METVALEPFINTLSEFIRLSIENQARLEAVNQVCRHLNPTSHELYLAEVEKFRKKRASESELASVANLRSRLIENIEDRIDADTRTSIHTAIELASTQEEKVEADRVRASSSSANMLATSALNWEVFVTRGLPIVMADRPAGVSETYFQATASTLIYGTRDAILVDAFMTVEQANALADWVVSKGKNLTNIYITHGHGDHWFGAGTLMERFPSVRVIATPDTVKVMRHNASAESLRAVWERGFPGQIPKNLVIAEELKGNVIDLEGRALIVVELGHTDTDNTTCLYVPSVGLVVAGDAAYNDVHLFLGESNAQTRQEWIAALDKIESLNPRAVIASHKRPGSDDHPRIIEETRQYIRDFDRLAATSKTAQDLYDKMLEIYPNRVNPGWALWTSARAVKA